MALTPQYAANPRLATASFSTANPNRDGTGAVVTLVTAPAGGLRVTRIMVKALAATSAGMIRLYLGQSTANGEGNILLDELPVPAITPSATTPSWQASFPLLQLDVIFLEEGQSLKISTERAEAFYAQAFAASF
jgi:hypothetical protein